jgi:hypothetical protein
MDVDMSLYDQSRQFSILKIPQEQRLQNVLMRKEQIDDEDRQKKILNLTKWERYKKEKE